MLERYLYDLESEIILIAERYRPDLLIKMLVTPSVAMARKPDEFSEQTASDNLNLLKELEYKACKIVTVNADLPTEEVDGQCKNFIWDVIRGQ